MCSETAPCVCCQAGVSHQSATLATGGVEELLADELDAKAVPHFAEGGTIPALEDKGDDSVLAMLMPGEYPVSADRAEQLGLNVDAQRLRDAEPEVEASAESQAEVQFITDDDAGTAGESVG